MKRMIVGFVVLLAAVITYGCGSLLDDGGDRDAVAPPIVPTSVKQTILATAGGTIQTADGKFKIDIPAGALDKDTEISMTPSADGLSYELQPDGLQLATPATVTMSVDLSLLGTVNDADGNPIDLTKAVVDFPVMLESADGTIEFLNHKTALNLGASNIVINADVAHFSTWRVAKGDDEFATVFHAQLGYAETADVGAIFGTAEIISLALKWSLYDRAELLLKPAPATMSPFAGGAVALNPAMIRSEGTTGPGTTGEKIQQMVVCTSAGDGNLGVAFNYSVEMLDPYNGYARVGGYDSELTISANTKCTEPAKSTVADDLAISTTSKPEAFQPVKSVASDLSKLIVIAAAADRIRGLFGLEAGARHAIVAGGAGTAIQNIDTGAIVQSNVLGSGRYWGVMGLSQSDFDLVVGWGENGRDTNRFDVAAGSFGGVVTSGSDVNATDGWAYVDPSTGFHSAYAIAEYGYTGGPGYVSWYNYNSTTKDFSDVTQLDSSWFPSAKGKPVSGQGGFYGEGALVLVTDDVNPGELWFGDINAAQGTLVGAVGNQPRKLRCFWGVCAVTNWADDTISILTWPNRSAAPAIVGTSPVGDGPVGVDLAIRSNGNVMAITTGYNDNTYTLTEINPADGSVVASDTYNLYGCQGPGHAAFLSDKQGMATCNTNGKYITFTLGQDGGIYSVGGTVSGMSGTLILQNNLGDDLTLTADGSFAFAAGLQDTSAYDVTVLAAPPGQACTVSGGSGSVNGGKVSNVDITCGAVYTVGGSVSGMTGGTLTLLNSGADALNVSGNGSFAFPTSVIDGTGYSVTVSANPTGQVCTVSNGSGTVSGANVANVAVACAAPPYTPGDLDTNFGTGGIASASFGASYESVSDMLMDADGKILLAGSADTRGLVRFNANGTLDTGFGGGDGMDNSNAVLDYIYRIATDSQGRIVAAGVMNFGSNFGVCRYSAAGVLDAAFGTGGCAEHDVTTGSDELYGLAVDAGDNAVVLGEVDLRSANTPRLYVERISGTDGSVDGTFTVTDISGASSYGGSILKDAQGRYVFVGSDSNNDLLIQRLNSNGTLDTTFGTNGTTTLDLSAGLVDSPTAMVIDGQGRILIAATYDYSNRVLVRLTANGALDSGFGTGGIVALNVPGDVSALTTDSSGRIIIARENATNVNVYRFSSDGSVDASFGTGGMAFVAATSGFSYVRDVVTGSDDSIYVAADFGTQPFAVIKMRP